MGQVAPRCAANPRLFRGIPAMQPRVMTHVLDVQTRPFTTSNYILVTITFRVGAYFGRTVRSGNWLSEAFVHVRMDLFVIVLYLGVLSILGLYGFHRGLLLYLYWKHRKDAPLPPTLFDDLPCVTGQ